MILKVDELKNICSAILPAVESSNVSTLSEMLQLQLEDNKLVLSVTNREYYVEVTLSVNIDETFFATVNANQFLKLVSQTTTDTITLTINDNALIFEGNGSYKLPIIYEKETILTLPKIEVENISTEFEIDGNILDSILKYNLKQISVGSICKPVQKLCYVDEEGAITFTSGACVNSFALEKPVKLLFNQRLVKLFKLFRDKQVSFSLGHSSISSSITQTRVSFKADNIIVDAILSSYDDLSNSVPVAAIRSRASKTYDYAAVLDKTHLLEAMDRIKLFMSSTDYHLKFLFSKDCVTISDIHSDNKETISYSNSIDALADTNYEACVNILEFQAILDVCTERYLTMNFGDHTAFAISRGNITNVISEEVLT